MSANCITFHNGQFSYDGCDPFSWSELGKDLVLSLLERQRYCDFGPEPEFTLNVMRKTGRTGRFYLNLDDERSPFGFDVDEAGELLKSAEQLEQQAQQLQDSGSVNQTRHPELGGKRIHEALIYSARQIRERAAMMVSEHWGRGPLSDGITLPLVKCANPKVGADAIWWDANAGVFHFGGYEVGPSKLGRLIALSLAKGDEWVTIGDITVTVNYLFHMCRITGETGQFAEVLDEDFCNCAPRTRR